MFGHSLLWFIEFVVYLTPVDHRSYNDLKLLQEPKIASVQAANIINLALNHR